MANSKPASVRSTVRERVMIEAGYRCAVPTCRALTPLDVHHIVEHAGGGSDEANNLICLCCNCHTRYHREKMPSTEAMKVYKVRLQELSRAVDREAIDVLIYLAGKGAALEVSGDKVAELIALLNAGYLKATISRGGHIPQRINSYYVLQLTDHGRSFVEAWQRGELV